MKLFPLAILSSTLIVLLAGCSQKRSITVIEQPVEKIISTGSVKATGVSICDSYLSAIQCIANNATGSDKINFNNSYESLVQSFQNVPAEQLSKTCTTLSDALRTHPTLSKDYPNCNTL